MISEQRVSVIFDQCLYKQEDMLDKIANPQQILQGITRRFGLHPGRLEEYREEVGQLLYQLPKKFRTEKGASFLDFNKDDLGEKWTGIPLVAEMLLILGMYYRRVRYITPMNTWGIMPGGVPDVRID